VLEQIDHQIQSEGRWMPNMLGIDTGDPNPVEKTRRGYIEKYRSDATRRLEICARSPTRGGARVRIFSMSCAPGHGC